MPPLPWSAVLTADAPAPVGPPPTSADYIDTPLAIVMVLGVAVTVFCLVVGLRGLAPGRWTLAVVWAFDAVLLAFLGWYIARTARGESPTGQVWELWAYVITLVLLPVFGVIWARQERTRWSAFVLAVACFVAWVMAARTNQVWYGVGLG